ncbi:MAG: hypothetical protein AB7O66_23250 [Limisphaerales bacterium]
MRFRTLHAGKYTLALLLGLTSEMSGRAQNLVLNPGFESGIDHWSGRFGAATGSPDTVSGSWIAVIPDRFQSGGLATEQAIVTTPGIKYDISFYLRLPELNEFGVPISGNSVPGTTTLRVRWDGNILADIPVTQRSPWIRYEFLGVPASADSTTLSFANRTSFADVFMDDVSVTAVPEVATNCLVAGILGLFAIRQLVGNRRSQQVG